MLIEEFLVGEEMSYFIISDGKEIKCFETAQDHKRVLEGDKGANTGGMGAYSPSRLLNQALEEKILNKIIEKVQEPSKVTPKKTLSIEKLPGKGKIIDVESTKTEIKEPVKPKRNLTQDLVGGIGKRLKYSPIGAALYTTEVGDAEIPLETSPRGYGVRRENKGRSSKDPNKNYNRQRFI